MSFKAPSNPSRSVILWFLLPAGVFWDSWRGSILAGACMVFSFRCPRRGGSGELAGGEGRAAGNSQPQVFRSLAVWIRLLKRCRVKENRQSASALALYLIKQARSGGKEVQGLGCASCVRGTAAGLAGEGACSPHIASPPRSPLLNHGF